MATENNLGDILSSLLANPEVMKAVSSLSQAPKEAPKSSATDVSEEGFTLPPQLLAKLPQMMSALSGLGGIQKEGSTSTENLPASQSLSKSDKERKALLFALKPYLSEKRCALIDGLLKLEGLRDLLSTFSDV